MYNKLGQTDSTGSYIYTRLFGAMRIGDYEEMRIGLIRDRWPRTDPAFLEGIPCDEVTLTKFIKDGVAQKSIEKKRFEPIQAIREYYDKLQKREAARKARELDTTMLMAQEEFITPI